MTLTRDRIKQLFRIAAFYDFVLGALFFLGWKRIYAQLGMTPPNHTGYIEFPAALVMTFGVGFWFVSKHPGRNRDIIKMGILLKASYVTVVLGHDFFGSVPALWVPFAWADLAFLVLFVLALRDLPPPVTTHHPAS